MTFRVFFCACVCGLLPPDGRFGTNAAGLSVPAISSEQVCLGSLIFSTLSPRISLEWALAEGVCSPPYCRRRRIPGLMKLPSCALWQFRWGQQSKAGLNPYGYA